MSQRNQKYSSARRRASGAAGSLRSGAQLTNSHSGAQRSGARSNARPSAQRPGARSNARPPRNSGNYHTSTIKQINKQQSTRRQGRSQMRGGSVGTQSRDISAPAQSRPASSTQFRNGGMAAGSQSNINVTPRAHTSRARRVVSIVLVTLAILAVAAGSAYAYARITGAFAIENVVVQGVDHLTDAEVAALAQIPEDATLLTIDTAGIKNRLMMDAWVRNASVTIQLPDTLNINVEEREIKAVVEMKSADSSTTTNWALSTDGMWLMPIPDRETDAGRATSAQIYEDAAAATHITGVPYSTNPQIGQYCSDSNVQNAIDILGGMTTSLKDQVKSVSATDAESTTLLLDNGIEIAFGTATDIRTKERVCLEILEEHEGSVAYINVRTVSKPTWRSA